MRLSKKLAACGVASRRKCEELIFAGKVKVNGAVVLEPQRDVTDQDQIKLNNQLLQQEQRKVYFMLNKPLGFVCTNSPIIGQKNVLRLLGNLNERLFTVGRLDQDTTGLLLITNDGHFANRVIHPSFNIHKEYLAKTDQEIMPEHLIALSAGTVVEDSFVKPVQVKKVRRGTVKITVSEGKKREVRELLASVGLNILSLERIRIGGLILGNLAIGNWRHLTQPEVDMFSGKEKAEKKSPDRSQLYYS